MQVESVKGVGKFCFLTVARGQPAAGEARLGPGIINQFSCRSQNIGKVARCSRLQIQESDPDPKKLSIIPARCNCGRVDL